MTKRDNGGRFAEGNAGGPGPAIGNVNGQKHGLNRLRRTVEELGGRLLDGRSATVKALNAWRTEIIRDLGGMQELTATKLAIVDLAAKQKLLLDSVDAWLLRQPSLVDEEKKAVLPVLRGEKPKPDAA